MVEEKKKNDVEEIKEIEKKTIVVEEIPKKLEEVPAILEETPLGKWIPRTSLGKQVMGGIITSMDQVLESGKKIREPEIVDKLLPGIRSELILIGGRGGKGGGKQRIPIRITAKMHSSGRRFRTSAFVVVGNEDGLVGVGKGSTIEPRMAMEKALKKAKLNLMKVRRGCGSWECGCDAEHSIPFKTKGRSGSVRVELLPAPKGVGLVANKEAKKLFRLAGIKDIWMSSRGNTANRINLISAISDALKKLYVYGKG